MFYEYCTVDCSIPLLYCTVVYLYCTVLYCSIPGKELQVELDQEKQDPGLTIRFECSALQTPVTK